MPDDEAHFAKDRPPVPAAEYVRMSTEHQQYSTENQSAAIREYAAKRGFEIVRTYADHGKSGLRIKGRTGLQNLIRDVQLRTNEFKAILVYDISRWGRFQDPDEAAHYEFICKNAGYVVRYVAELFENDGSLVSDVAKVLKRTSSGEYARELSVKVFAGQSRLIRLGFRQGGAAGYGLRRKLVDVAGASKGILGRGEHKSIQTDRVVLAPGPEAERDTVRSIYRLFTEEGKTEREIADILNGRGICTDLARPWTRGTINQVLTNEKYIGNNVWNRHSFKLKRQHVTNTPELWVRADEAFEAIIDVQSFLKARAIMSQRAKVYSESELLDHLRELVAKHGYLSGIIIDEAEDGPTASTYRSRFGSLLRAYSLVGYTPERDYRFLEINRRLRALYPRLTADVMSGIQHAGGDVQREAETDLLRINDEFTASVVIARCEETARGALRWTIRLESSLSPDITVAMRMGDDNREPRDYYLFPRIDICLLRLRLAEYNGVSLDAYRFDNLDSFYQLSSRINVLDIAS